MAYSYKGSLSFGLIYIPITLHISVKNNDIGFNMLDKNTMSRVQYKKTCTACGGREVKQEDIVKGYEYEEGKYVVFEESDFEKIKAPKDKSINIERFVNISDIDPIYYDKCYYINPTGGEKAFSLLLQAMESKNKVGIAKTVLGTKETLIAIRVKGGKMLLNTLFFDDEILTNPTKQIKEEVKEAELNMAKMIIDGMSGVFEPKLYKDEYQEKIKQAIEEKISGKEISKPKQDKEHNVADLMEALQLTLKSTQKSMTLQKPKKKAASNA